MLACPIRTRWAGILTCLNAFASEPDHKHVAGGHASLGLHAHYVQLPAEPLMVNGTLGRGCHASAVCAPSAGLPRKRIFLSLLWAASRVTRPP